MRLNRLGPKVAVHRQPRIPAPQAAPGATEMERGRAWMAKRERVALRYGYRCASCGLVLLPGGWECDHIVPREQGGSNDESNLQPMCKEPCHRLKSASEAECRAKARAG